MRRDLLCPECCVIGPVVERKALVTQLRRCPRCHLLYRTPTIPASEMSHFYQSDYVQNAITEIPDQATLDGLKAKAFFGTSLDYSEYISTILRLGYGENASVYDFGCSWGYGIWQFNRAGFRGSGWEIDPKRLDFGVAHLQVKNTRLDELADNSVDVFFSSHVIEHVPFPKQLIEQALPKLKSSGILFFATPNGSALYRSKWPQVFRKLWGLSHPQLIDDRFLQPIAGDKHHLAITSQIREITPQFVSNGHVAIGDLTDVNLFFTFKPK